MRIVCFGLQMEGKLVFDSATHVWDMRLQLGYLGKVYGGSKVPSVVAFIVWTATLSSILTVDNPIKWKMVVNRCIMSKCSCKTMSFGLLYSKLSGFYGWCQGRWWICWLYGEECLAITKTRWWGKLRCIVLCGWYVERGIVGTLRNEELFFGGS